MTGNYLEINRASRKELRDFIARLEDADFERSVGNGWTVGTMLCHMAFWDQVALARLKRWGATQFEPVQIRDQHTDDINAAARFLSRVIPARQCAQLVIESAEAVDRELEQVNEDLAGRIAAAGLERILHRSMHRRDHLRTLEQALGGRTMGMG